MGNDGGSIPDRRDLVKTKAKAEQADKANQTRARWFFCALSKRPLQEPVVSCALGKLYNKDAILEYLLDKSTYGDGQKICGHIRSLKDVKTLTLTHNPSPSSASVSPGSIERAVFVCPLSLKEMNGSQPFVYIQTCGCVLSQAGLKTMGKSSAAKEETDGQTEEPAALDICPQCSTKFSYKDDVLLLNPSETEEEKMRETMDRRRLLEPAKTKKSKKRKASEEDGDGSKKKTKTSVAPAPSSNPSIAAASRAVMSSLAMEEAKRKVEMSEAVRSLYGDGKGKRTETFMTRGTFTRYA